MASKKTKQHKMSTAAPGPSVFEVYTYVDTNKSIDELFQAGRVSDGKLYERKPNRVGHAQTAPPSSFKAYGGCFVPHSTANFPIHFEHRKVGGM